MATDLVDATFSYLLRCTIPLVVAPPGPLSPREPRLRGVVRPNDERARVVLSDDPGMASGLAVEFTLASDGRPLEVESAIDYMRTTVAADMKRLLGWQPHVLDSHLNVIVEASEAGFTAEAAASTYDHSLFGLFSLLVHGGGFPWFEDVYTFAGFMIRGDRCRIYIRVTNSGTVYGIEIPLTHADGRPLRRFGGSLPQELASLVPDGDLATKPMIDDRDDYCSQVFDLTSWVLPAAPAA